MLRNASDFCPPANRNKKLDAAINFLNSLNLSARKREKSNLTKEQWKTANDLRNNDNIVIKETDKGGCVVIMNKSHYISMVYDQLNDGVTYQGTEKSWDQTVVVNLTKLVDKYQNSLTEKEVDYLKKI